MTIWKVQDAKSRFSEFLNLCVSDGPQMVTRRGIDTAVLVPVAEWNRLKEAQRPSLKDLLLSETPKFDLNIPPRGRAKRRAPVTF